MDNDIDNLIKSMSVQFTHMRTDYTTQIAAIEAEFEHERSDIKDRNEEEIKSLFEEHKKLEE